MATTEMSSKLKSDHLHLKMIWDFNDCSGCSLFAFDSTNQTSLEDCSNLQVMRENPDKLDPLTPQLIWICCAGMQATDIEDGIAIVRAGCTPTLQVFCGSRMSKSGAPNVPIA